MYLYDTKISSTHTRIKDGKEIPFKSTKTIHHFKCNNCNSEFFRPRNGKLRDTQLHYCSNCPQLSLAAKATPKTRHNNLIEKGYKLDRGYKEIYVGEEYQYGRRGWVREHIVVTEQQLGKKIPDGMVVHHIDGSKQNNQIDNLLLCTKQEHNNCHAKIERLVFELYEKGLVGFDKNTLTYYYKG